VPDDCEVPENRYAARMFGFKVLKRSTKSQARLGVISTAHGDVETPTFIPVATRASARLMDSKELAASQAQMLICNTFHLHIAPGEKLVQKAGGIHGFMHWDKPLMTDSGGFQVFSLGFGKDHGVGKILKEAPQEQLDKWATPSNVKIGEDGVEFNSPLDGTRLFLGPKKSIQIQEALGADIMFAFDECPSPLASIEYLHKSLEKTHRWAKVCLDTKKSKKQALYGIVQGGAHKELRLESARLIRELPFDGFGIGGEFGYDKKSMGKMLGLTHAALPEGKPRHVLGVGHPEDFEVIAKAGGDTFDCIAPTHYARRGVLFTSKGRLDLRSPKMVKYIDRPIDKTCKCPVCTTYSLGYVSHLIRANELTGMMLATTHNVYYFNALAAKLRARIKKGEI
jgi:queuine tRNA-ribosyltransferase/7-cyano-7-deazaguanine tRNA-ribosyltransferase